MVVFNDDFERPDVDEVRQAYAELDTMPGGGMPVSSLRGAMSHLGVTMTQREVIRAVSELKDQGLNKIELEDFEYIVNRVCADSVLWDADELSLNNPPFFLKKLKEWVNQGDLAKERARPFRRTVFQDADWRTFRSSFRLIDNLTGFFGKSEVLRGQYLELGVMLLISTAVWGLNTLLVANLIPGVVLPPFSLSLVPHQLSATALAFFLVFRTNNSYTRYEAARNIWGLVVDNSIDIVRMGMDNVKDKKINEELARRTVAFSKILKKVTRFGRREEDILKKELTALLGTSEADRLLGSKHRTVQALQDISRVIVAVEHDDSIVRSRMHAAVGALLMHCGTIIRLYRGPLPLAYTRFSGRFLAVWLFTLPFAMWKELGGSWLMIPVSVGLSAVYFSIDELGIQIEEPFSILPLEGMCETIESSVREILANDVTTETRPVGVDAAKW